MSITKTVDARGLSCPQPVLMTQNALKELQAGEIEIFVDTEASRENVSRFAGKSGWMVTVENRPDGSFRLLLKK